MGLVRVKQSGRRDDVTVKALRFEQYGPPSVLRIREMPRPVLEGGEVLIEVKASSLNPSDLATVAGRFHSELPMRPGRDFAGVVVDGGAWDRQTGSGGGRRFWDNVPRRSCWIHRGAFFLAVRKAEKSKYGSGGRGGSALPRGVAVSGGSGPSATREPLLITGAGGAVGSAAIQIAHWKGASVLAADIAEGLSSADMFLNLKETNLVNGVQQATGGKGVDIVLDTVGPTYSAHASGRSGSGEGRSPSRNVAGRDTEVHFNLTDFYHNQIHLIGVDTFKLTWPEIADIMNYLRDGFDTGFLQVSEPERNAFDKAVEAYTKLSEKRSRAKQVLTFVNPSPEFIMNEADDPGVVLSPCVRLFVGWLREEGL